MKVVFLGEEGQDTDNGSYDMGARVCSQEKKEHQPHTDHDFNNTIDAYFEVWDYFGEFNFRGFVGGNCQKKSLFVFFETDAIRKDLKKGLMALIDFAETVFDVPLIVICLERSISEDECKPFLKSLHWVGFMPITLDIWTGVAQVTSKDWLLLGMQV
ncbi:putative ornithine decarboxylase antizyme [Golovinomyces cichoracearum]|uniref:Ornithine decarboxylase antizyme n=1 Tax=Golovinomyces cichoracearum TaxID=62708 RepID=A0A420IZB1_9PEZI|nr:putative ornithine decarboxylase antizyme [Golovinomyces cichoracearum]